MLDVKLLRRDTDRVKKALGRRGVKPETIDAILALDVKRRDLITKADELKKERNSVKLAPRSPLLTQRKLLLRKSKSIW